VALCCVWVVQGKQCRRYACTQGALLVRPLGEGIFCCGCWREVLRCHPREVHAGPFIETSNHTVPPVLIMHLLGVLCCASASLRLTSWGGGGAGDGPSAAASLPGLCKTFLSVLTSKDPDVARHLVTLRYPPLQVGWRKQWEDAGSCGVAAMLLVLC
jgi:hypothetical protein